MTFFHNLNLNRNPLIPWEGGKGLGLGLGGDKNV
jgi:hypothetical protein